MNSILYLLVREDRSAFKIGVTKDLVSRHSRLSCVWGNIDLSSSCMVSGSRHDVAGLEKTLHYLLERWRIQQPKGLDGCREWFDMACFEKAKEIILEALCMRSGNPEEAIVHGVIIPERKPKSRIKTNQMEIVDLEDVKELWPSYEKGTIDFCNTPSTDDLWLWTMDLQEFQVSPYESLRFKSGNECISIATGLRMDEDKPSVVYVFLSKRALAIMKNTKKFGHVHDFLSEKFYRLACMAANGAGGLSGGLLFACGLAAATFGQT